LGGAPKINRQTDPEAALTACAHCFRRSIGARVQQPLSQKT
jgi:hypothetical protein